MIGREATNRKTFMASGLLFQRRKGFALVLALSVLMVVTLMVSIMEGILVESWKSSKNSTAKVRADWACYGAVVQAAASPPDSVTRYSYAGTDVDITVHNPPLSVMEIVMDPTVNPDQTPVEGTFRMLCAEAQSPSQETTALVKWCYVIRETDRPEIWTSWPSVFGSTEKEE